LLKKKKKVKLFVQQIFTEHLISVLYAPGTVFALGHSIEQDKPSFISHKTYITLDNKQEKIYDSSNKYYAEGLVKGDSCGLVSHEGFLKRCASYTEKKMT
jgi:hypothetical protein